MLAQRAGNASIVGGIDRTTHSLNSQFAIQRTEGSTNELAQLLDRRNDSKRDARVASQAPVLVRRQLTYWRATQFAGRLVTLCFLPYVGIVGVDRILATERAANEEDALDITTTFLKV